MSDWISKTKALAVLQLRLPSLTDSVSLLDEAISNNEIVVQRLDLPVRDTPIDFSDPIRLYAGGLTLADLGGTNLGPEVSRRSLEDWISDLRGEGQKVKPHRPEGRSMKSRDKPAVDKMRELIVSGSATGPHRAAHMVIAEDPTIRSSGSPDSNVRRLTGRYKEAYGD